MFLSGEILIVTAAKGEKKEKTNNKKINILFTLFFIFIKTPVLIFRKRRGKRKERSQNLPLSRLVPQMDYNPLDSIS
jgi:hypothetical protein